MGSNENQAKSNTNDDDDDDLYNDLDVVNKQCSSSKNYSPSAGSRICKASDNTSINTSTRDASMTGASPPRSTSIESSIKNQRTSYLFPKNETEQHATNRSITSYEEQIKLLKQENNTLKRNMGTLYRTAKLELDRKDGRILELEQEIQKLYQQGKR